MKKKEYCPICGNETELKKLNIYPIIHYKGSGATARLCQDCIDKWEDFMLPLEGTFNRMRRRRTTGWYRSLFFVFLGRYRMENKNI